MASPFPLLFFCFVLSFSVHVKGLINEDEGDVWDVGRLLVKKDQRRSLVSTEYGEISAAEIYDGTTKRPYHLEFITLEPNSLFLPVVLHADMVFYVHTGSGKLSWSNEDEMLRVRLQKGDVYRLQPGTIFYVQSNLEPEREKLRISAIFATSIDDLHEPSIGAYSSVSDLVRGFDKKVLQAAFKVPEDVIEAITSATHSPQIVHAVPKRKRTLWEWEVRFINGFLGTKGNSISDVENKRKKTRTFNVLTAKPDFQNCNGRSLTVTRKDLKALKGSDFGVFMVNLTRGAMMGPHWNPLATEISMVIQGEGMVRVVCSSNASNTNESQCKNMRFRVTEGDVFAVPRYHPMAQMSFNNDSLVFVGFSTTTKKSYPQFLVGKASVLHALDKEILAASFNVSNTTIDQLLASQADSIILECTSCAEEELRILKEEIERKEEAAKKREEEEKARREEEEREQREREQQEEEKRQQEEEQRRQEEEREQREKEEAREREEEEKARREEEEREQREREQEEEEEKRQQEERRQEEEREQREKEEARKREEEEKARREEEEREQREREQQEEEEKRQQEEKARREEEEREQREREQQQQQEKRQQEEEQRRQEEERERQEKEREQQEQEGEGGGGGGGQEGRRVLKKMWKI